MRRGLPQVHLDSGSKTAEWMRKCARARGALRSHARKHADEILELCGATGGSRKAGVFLCDDDLARVEAGLPLSDAEATSDGSGDGSGSQDEEEEEDAAAGGGAVAAAAAEASGDDSAEAFMPQGYKDGLEGVARVVRGVTDAMAPPARKPAAAKPGAAKPAAKAAAKPAAPKPAPKPKPAPPAAAKRAAAAPPAIAAAKKHKPAAAAPPADDAFNQAVREAVEVAGELAFELAFAATLPGHACEELVRAARSAALARGAAGCAPRLTRRVCGAAQGPAAHARRAGAAGRGCGGARRCHGARDVAVRQHHWAVAG